MGLGTAALGRTGEAEEMLGTENGASVQNEQFCALSVLSLQQNFVFLFFSVPLIHLASFCKSLATEGIKLSCLTERGSWLKKLKQSG